MARMPHEVRIALEEGLARASNLIAQLQFPPGTTYLTFGPPVKRGVWCVYGWQYGDLSPAGPTADFYIIWEQRGIRRFTDYMVPSVIDFEYPEWVFVTGLEPVASWFVNNTGAVQTLDFIAFIAYFNDFASFRRWWERLIEIGLRDRIPHRVETMVY